MAQKQTIPKISELNKEENYLFPVYLNVAEKNNKKGLELRKLTTDSLAIKTILSCALHDRPIIIYPTFRNKLQAISSLVENGYLKINKQKNQYEFII